MATLKAELVDRKHWSTREALRVAAFEYPENFYNRRRPHSSLGYMGPELFEEDRMRGSSAA